MPRVRSISFPVHGCNGYGYVRFPHMVLERTGQYLPRCKGGIRVCAPQKKDTIFMEKYLDAYLERMKPEFGRVPGKTGHDIASVFLAYRFGLYSKAVRECSAVLPQVPDGSGSAALKKAISIAGAYAQAFENSQVKPDQPLSFTEEERAYVAVNLPRDRIEDPDTLELDNALVLIYAVAMIASVDDEEALEEHRKYVVVMLGTYKRALGLH